MGWIAKVKIDKPPHNCDMYKPSIGEIFKEMLGPGSVWECPKCKARYLYRGSFAGVPEWEKGYTT